MSDISNTNEIPKVTELYVTPTQVDSIDTSLIEDVPVNTAVDSIDTSLIEDVPVNTPQESLTEAVLDEKIEEALNPEDIVEDTQTTAPVDKEDSSIASGLISTGTSLATDTATSAVSDFKDGAEGASAAVDSLTDRFNKSLATNLIMFSMYIALSTTIYFIVTGSYYLSSNPMMLSISFLWPMLFMLIVGITMAILSFTKKTAKNTVSAAGSIVPKRKSKEDKAKIKAEKKAEKEAIRQAKIAAKEREARLLAELAEVQDKVSSLKPKSKLKFWGK